MCLCGTRGSLLRGNTHSSMFHGKVSPFRGGKRLCFLLWFGALGRTLELPLLLFCPFFPLFAGFLLTCLSEGWESYLVCSHLRHKVQVRTRNANIHKNRRFLSGVTQRLTLGCLCSMLAHSVVQSCMASSNHWVTSEFTFSCTDSLPYSPIPLQFARPFGRMIIHGIKTGLGDG